MTSPKSAFPHLSGGLPDKDSFVNLFINSKADFAPSETTSSSQSQSAANGMAASEISMIGTLSSVSYSMASDLPGSQSRSESNVADGQHGQPLLRMPPRPALLVKPLDTDMQTMPLAALASPKKDEVDLFAHQQHSQAGQSASQLLEEPPKQESSSSLLDILNSPPPVSNQAGGNDASQSIHTWTAVQHDLGNVNSSPFTAPASALVDRQHRDRPPSRPPSPSKQATIPSWASAPFRSPSSDSSLPPDRIGTLSPPRAATQPNQSPMTVPLLLGSTPRPQAEYQLSTSPPPMNPASDARRNSHTDNSDHDDEEDDEEEEDRNTEANASSTEPAEKPNPRKKKKNIYPPEARKMLHDYFQNVSRNPNKQQRLEMVTLVGSNEKTIRIWFQNQRQKLAKLERRRLARINGLQPTLADLTAPGMPILPAPPKNTSLDSLHSGNFLQTATPSSYHGSTYQMPAVTAHPPPPTPGLPMPPPPTPGFPMHGAALSSSQMQQMQQQHLQQHFQQQQQHGGAQNNVTYVTRAGIISPVTPTFLQNQAAAAAVAAAAHAHAQAQAQAQQQSQGNSPHFIHLHHSNFNTGQPFLTHTGAASTSPTRFPGSVQGMSPPLASPALHAGAASAHLSHGALVNAAAYPSPDFMPSASMPPPTPPAHLVHYHTQHHHQQHFASPGSVLPPLPESAGVTPAFGTLQLATTASPSPQVLHHGGGPGAGYAQHHHSQGAGQQHVSALGFAAHAPGGAPAMPPPLFATDATIQRALFPSDAAAMDSTGSYVSSSTGDWSSVVQADTVSMASSMSMMSGAAPAPAGLVQGGSKLAAHVMSFASGEAGEAMGQHQQQGQQGGCVVRAQQGLADVRGHMQ